MARVVYVAYILSNFLLIICSIILFLSLNKTVRGDKVFWFYIVIR